MINKISIINNNKLFAVPSFRSNEVKQEVTNPMISESKEDLDLKALESYSMAKIGMNKKYDIQPLIPTIYLPEAIDAIKGQRVFDSQGKLDSIIYEDGDTKTSYIFDKENEGMIKNITSTDKKTGNIIKKQENIIDDGEYDEIYITLYSPTTGKEVYFTAYEDGKPEYASKYIYGKNGSVKTISRNFKYGETYISETSKDGKLYNSIKMSKDMKYVTVNAVKTVKNKEFETSAHFYNGALISVDEKKHTEMPNLVGLEPMSDNDFAPEPELTRLGWQKLAESLEGEKTYYSNGAIESAKGNIEDLEVTAFFNSSGQVKRVVAENEVVEIGENHIKRTEIKKDGIKKTTMIHNDGFRNVIIEKDGRYKEACINKNNKISSYYEGTVDADGERDFEISLYYNETGQLASSYGN